MSEKDFVTEIAKQLPVKQAYDDALSPGMKQLGGITEDLMKTLRLVLAPIQLTAGLQDRFRRFVESSVAKVPESERIAPPPQIIGPVLEGVRYETEGTPIDQMFRDLLASSMDASKVERAHPAFPSIIKQLSSDEAVLLRAIFNSHTPLALVQKFTITHNGQMSFSETESDELGKTEVRFPLNYSMYIGHLEKLGLIQTEMTSPMTPIYEKAGGPQTGGRNYFAWRLTEFGRTFMRAVTFAEK